MKIIKFIVPLFLISFLTWNIIRDWQLVYPYWLDFKPTPIIIAFLFFLAIYPEGALSWYVILRKMGFKVPIKDSIKVWVISTASRYIPGTIWQYLGRVEIAHRVLDLARKETIISLLFEIFIGVTASIVIALFALPFIFTLKIPIESWMFLLPLILIPLHPNISKRIIEILAKLLKKEFKANFSSLGIKETLLVFFFSSLNFFLNGAALFFLISSLYHDKSIDFLQITGIYSLSWIIGYVSIFAPAGIGVAEASLAYFLSFTMPFALSSLIALSYRFFLTLAELTIFILSLKLGGNKKWRKI